MTEIWKLAFGVAGVGAIAAFVVWSLYREWLRLPIFQEMTKEQQYRIFILFILLIFLFGLAGLGSYIYVTKQSTDHYVTDDYVLSTEVINRIKQIERLCKNTPHFSEQGIEDARKNYNDYFNLTNTFGRSLREIYYGVQGRALHTEFNGINLTTLLSLLSHSERDNLEAAKRASEDLHNLLVEDLTDSRSYIPDKDYVLLQSDGTISRICDGLLNLKQKAFPDLFRLLSDENSNKNIYGN